MIMVMEAVDWDVTYGTAISIEDFLIHLHYTNSVNEVIAYVYSGANVKAHDDF